MKIILVQSPNLQRSGEWKKMKVSRPPINIALLASYLREFGYEPFIYDLDWFGGSIDEMARLILSRDPDIVGFTCLTPRIEVTLSIAAKIKEFNPEVKIVIGGAHVNAVREQSLYTRDIDYAIYAEGEDALVELIKTLEDNGDVSKVRNLIYRKNERIITNPARPFIQDIDKLPFPAWDLLNLEDYKDPAVFSGIHMGVMTTRGCPWNCVFCSSGVVWGRNVRFRSAENVADELEYIVVKLGITNVMFYDDIFTLNKMRFLKICQEIMKRKLNLRYYCQLRVDTIDEEVACGLAESGCITAALGIESGDEEILKTLKKGFNKSQVYKAVDVLKSAGVPILASYILGSPGETHESIKKTFEFARELDIEQAKFMICTPFPGTDLFKMAVEKGILSNNLTPTECSNITYYQHVAANLSKVSDEELKRYQRDAYSFFQTTPHNSLKKIQRRDG